MPIKIPDSLPATAQLEKENIFVMTEHRALHQDIRPLRVLLLNLMPTKITTETQILRKLSNTPLQIEVELLPHEKPRREKRLRRAPGNVLRLLRRREDEHFDGSSSRARRRAARFPRRRLLGRAHAHHGLVENERPFHSAYLLGSPSGHLLSLRHREVRA